MMMSLTIVPHRSQYQRNDSVVPGSRCRSIARPIVPLIGRCGECGTPGRCQPQLAGPDRDLADAPGLADEHRHVAVELVEQLRHGVDVVVAAGASAGNDHDPQLAVEERAGAAFVERAAVLRDPGADVDRRRTVLLAASIHAVRGNDSMLRPAPRRFANSMRERDAWCSVIA